MRGGEKKLEYGEERKGGGGRKLGGQYERG